jgi:hypothetical protein
MEQQVGLRGGRDGARRDRELRRLVEGGERRGKRSCRVPGASELLEGGAQGGRVFGLPRGRDLLCEGVRGGRLCAVAAHDRQSEPEGERQGGRPGGRMAGAE